MFTYLYGHGIQICSKTMLDRGLGEVSIVFFERNSY
jgi:hypothetical protein